MGHRLTDDGSRRHPILWSLVGSFILAAILGITLPNVFRGDEAHLASHLTLAVPAWLLSASLLRSWPPPRADNFSRIARYGLLAALLALATGASVESLGAVGYDGMLGNPFLAGFHPLGVAITTVGIALTFSAIGINLLVWGVARVGKLNAAWMPYATSLVGFGGIAFILGAIVFGY